MKNLIWENKCCTWLIKHWCFCGVFFRDVTYFFPDFIIPTTTDEPIKEEYSHNQTMAIIRPHAVAEHKGYYCLIAIWYTFIVQN